MISVPVCKSEALAEGAMLNIAHGTSHVLVCRVEGKLYAVDAVCPHRGAMLTQGRLEGCAVVCPWHDWAFDVTTGEGLTNPVSSICRYEVLEQDGEVVVQLPEEADANEI